MNFFRSSIRSGISWSACCSSCCALALVAIAAAQLWQGVQLFDESPIGRAADPVLEAIAVLTVAVAALELGQTILEEEVLREAQ